MSTSEPLMAAVPPMPVQVDVYGFHISERQGVPYHYHNRCPQPFANRDSAEWMMVKSFSDHRLLELKDLCVSECHSSDEECQSCKVECVTPALIPLCLISPTP